MHKLQVAPSSEVQRYFCCRHTSWGPESPSPGKNTGVGWHSLFQGIFLTQGLNVGLLHCRQILYPLSHQWSSSLLLTGLLLTGIIWGDTQKAFLIENISKEPWIYSPKHLSSLLLLLDHKQFTENSPFSVQLFFFVKEKSPYDIPIGYSSVNAAHLSSWSGLPDWTFPCILSLSLGTIPWEKGFPRASCEFFPPGVPLLTKP